MATRARAASASSRWARRSTGRSTCGAASAARSKAIRRRPRRAPPTSPMPGCRRRPTWRSTTSRCASPSSACGSSRRRWRPSRARSRSCRTSSTPASSRASTSRRRRPSSSRRAPSSSPRTSTARTFEHAVAVLVGKAPSELSVEPGPLPHGGADLRAPACPRRCSSGGPTSPRPNGRWRRPTPRSASP